MSSMTCCWKLDKEGMESMSFGTYYRLDSKKAHEASTKGSSAVTDSDEHLNCKIWEIGRATTAAPTYFKAVKMKRFEHARFTDGGFPGYNNPTLVAYTSIKQTSGGVDMPFTIVSIGTGKKKTEQKRGAWWAKGPLEIDALIQSSLEFATESEITHQIISGMLADNSKYWRLNVSDDIGNVVLDDWRGSHGCDTLDQLDGATKRYLRNPETRESIKEVAKSLVSIRRARANDKSPDLWERYCHGVYYRCDANDCDKKTMHYARTDFSNHLKLAHRFGEEEVREKLESRQFRPECFEGRAKVA